LARCWSIAGWCRQRPAPSKNGVEALELLKPNPEIALLVSDVNMPRMDGYAQDLPPQFLKAWDIQILHKSFNLEKLCTLAAEIVT